MKCVDLIIPFFKAIPQHNYIFKHRVDILYFFRVQSCSCD